MFFVLYGLTDLLVVLLETLFMMSVEDSENLWFLLFYLVGL